MADDDRPRFSGRIPASGAPLNARTLALRPGGQSLSQGDLTSSDAVANAVYNFLQSHPGLGVPEQGQQNLAETARTVEQNTPWGQGEEAIKSARVGDFPGTVSGIFGAMPILGAAGGVAARVGKTAAKDAGESVASNLAKRAVMTAGTDAAESVAPAAAEAAAPTITGQVSAGASAPPPIVAYHGSPHSFDRFDISKIGTGEGAQAYGHGLYFADNEGVAKSYRDALTGGKWTYAGQPSSENWDASALDYLDRKVVNEQGMPAAFNEAIGRLQNSSKFYNDTYGGSGSNLYDNAVARLQRMDPSQVKAAGSMYQVGINADPNSFLDWDKPISEQSPSVQKALSGMFGLPDDFLPDGAGGWATPGSVKGRDIYDTAGRQAMIDGNVPSPTGGVYDQQVAAELATKRLRDAGVSGIRYLDQGSRGTSGGQLISVQQTPQGWQSRIKVSDRGGVGFTDPTDVFTTSKPYPSEAEARQWADSKINSGTNNYVLFDDSLASILKKYGLAGLGTVGGAAALTAGGQSSMSPVSPAEAAPAPLPDQQSPPPVASAAPPGFDDWWRQLQAQRFSSSQQPF